MEDFLGFSRFLWKISQLDLIFEHEKFKNLTSKNDKLILRFKKCFLFFILLNILFINYIFSTLLTKQPIDAKYLGETFYNCSLLFINLIEIFILYFNREEICEILKKLPRKFSPEENEKFNLKSSIRKTKIFYTIIGAICSATAFYYISRNFVIGKFMLDFKFPFDISNQIVFNAISLDFMIVEQFACIFVTINPIFKFGLIFVASVEFMKLREEFRELRKEVRKILTKLFFKLFNESFLKTF